MFSGIQVAWNESVAAEECPVLPTAIHHCGGLDPIRPPHNHDFKYIPLLAVSDVVNQEPLNAPVLASPLYRPPKECVVAAANWFRYAYRAYFSQPRNVRQLYKLIKRNNVARIVEIGTSDVQRTVSLIEVAQRYAEGQKVFHTAVDGFDARPARPRTAFN